MKKAEEYIPTIESEKESELPPSWFKVALNSALDSILTPKNFESPELYEKLGIRTFKKYMPTTGDLMYKYVWKKLVGSNQITLNKDSVETALSTTIACEIIHYALLALYSVSMYRSYESGNMTGLTVGAALNALVNVYPIMLQRYNRMRLTSLKDTMERRSKKIYE